MTEHTFNGGGSGGDARHKRRLDRDVAASIVQHPSESKADYLARLAALVPNGKLARITAQLLESTDDRVRSRALELVTRLKGWLGPDVDARSIHVHGNTGLTTDDVLSVLKHGGAASVGDLIPEGGEDRDED